jgi:hypothetical protein
MRYAPTLGVSRKRVLPCRNDPSACAAMARRNWRRLLRLARSRADASFRRVLSLGIRRSFGPSRGFPRVACSVNASVLRPGRCPASDRPLLANLPPGPSQGFTVRCAASFRSVSRSVRRPRATPVPVRELSAHDADFRSVSRSVCRPRATPVPFRVPSADGEPNASPQAESCPAREQVGRGPSVNGQAFLLRLPVAD